LSQATPTFDLCITGITFVTVVNANAYGSPAKHPSYPVTVKQDLH